MSLVKKYSYMVLISLSALLGVFKITLFAKLLGPEQYGLYALVLSVYVFLIYFGGLGLNEAFIKLGSRAFGQSDIVGIYELHILAAIYGGAATLVLGCLFSVTVIFLIDDPSVSLVLALASLLAITALEFNLLDALLRVTHRFVLYSIMVFSKSLIVIFIGWNVALEYGAYGVVVSEVFGFMIVSIVTYYLVETSVSINTILKNYELLFHAIKNGLPMMLSNVIRNLMLSADKWLLGSSLGMSAVGQYSFAMILYTMSIFLLGFITTVLGPKWLASYSNGHDAKKLLRSILSYSYAWFVLLFLLAIPAYILLPMGIDFFFVEYRNKDVILTMSIIYIGVMFLIPCCFLDWFFMAISFEKKVLNITISMMVLSLFLLGICWYLGLSIVAYAVVFSANRIYVFLRYLKVISSLKRQNFESVSS